MYCKSLRKTLLKFIITSFLFINWGYNQDDQDKSFFDGPHIFYTSDSIIVNYYNFGVKESFQFSCEDTTIFHGHFQDSLVTYIIPKLFSNPSDNYNKTDKIFVVYLEFKNPLNNKNLNNCSYKLCRQTGISRANC